MKAQRNRFYRQTDTEWNRIQRVEARLGDGQVICERCGATLDTFADKCAAQIDERCAGFEAIEAAGKPS